MIGIMRLALHHFKDKLVISSVPNYFNNTETPITCYKYKKGYSSQKSQSLFKICSYLFNCL